MVQSLNSTANSHEISRFFTQRAGKNKKDAEDRRAGLQKDAGDRRADEGEADNFIKILI